MKRRIISFILIMACLSLIFLAGCNRENENNSGIADDVRYPEVTLVIKDYGTIKIKLYPNKAPETVNNFIYLINKGYYNGLTFHRIMEGFMIQGGDPNGDGTGGPGYTIKGEFSQNDFSQNDLTHARGVVSMARSNSYNSGGSQFFIMHDENTGLDGQYAAFGKVIEGIEVVDEIVKLPVKDSNGTLTDPETAPVIESITVDTFGKKYPEPNMLK